MKKFSSIVSILLLALVFASPTIGQEAPKRIISPQDTVPISLSEKRFNEQYAKNIKKTRINGVYIPADLMEAFAELTALSSKESLDKFKGEEADFVVRRLHYGLGRWIIVNWNLFDGSRIGHHLKSYGVSHPDDQVRFLLYAFHNHLNNKDLELEAIAKRIQAERATELEARKSNN